GVGTTQVNEKLGELSAALVAGLRWLRREAQVGLREWRRARLAKRKVRSKQTYLLAATWLLLLAVFAWSLSFLSPASVGTRLTLDELAALAGQHRIASAQFLDQDAQIVGAFTCTATNPTKVPAAKASGTPSAATEAPPILTSPTAG